MQILAHRANIDGPAAGENSFEAIRTCVDRGWGLELDIRRCPGGRFYFSHDAQLGELPSSHDGERILGLLAASDSPVIALNIKELGYESELTQAVASHGLLERSFIFDMELIEPRRGETAARLRAACDRVRLAQRVSDRAEPLDDVLAPGPDVIWLDEFDTLWATEGDIRRLKDAGATIYAVSPELHGFSSRDRDRRWREFADWGVDGICTDYPSLLEHVQSS